MAPHDAMTAYFSGERSEMIAILIGAIAVIAASGSLWVWMRDGFAAGFAITAIAAGLLLAGTAVALLARDNRTAPALVQAVSTPGTAAATTAREAKRIDTVIRNYPTYRYVAAGLVALAFAGLVLTGRGWIHGVAAALIVVAAAQIVIDHYSEQRARRYAERLALA